MENEVNKIAKFYNERGIKHNPGYVYILSSDNGLYKIGKSKDPKGRINTLKTASPVKIELYRLFMSSDMDDAEAMLHYMFSDFREIGEWFRLSEKELQELNDREGDHLLTHCFI